MARLYVSRGGDEALYESDLPSCCRRAAWGAEGGFVCPTCGAEWGQELAGELTNESGEQE